jgi:hypothetical protein
MTKRDSDSPEGKTLISKVSSFVLIGSGCKIGSGCEEFATNATVRK